MAEMQYCTNVPWFKLGDLLPQQLLLHESCAVCVVLFTTLDTFFSYKLVTN
jgi:hypothetical protein